MFLQSLAGFREEGGHGVSKRTGRLLSSIRKKPHAKWDGLTYAFKSRRVVVDRAENGKRALQLGGERVEIITRGEGKDVRSYREAPTIPSAQRGDEVLQK